MPPSKALESPKEEEKEAPKLAMELDVDQIDQLQGDHLTHDENEEALQKEHGSCPCILFFLIIFMFLIQWFGWVIFMKFSDPNYSLLQNDFAHPWVMVNGSNAGKEVGNDVAKLALTEDEKKGKDGKGGMEGKKFL